MIDAVATPAPEPPHAPQAQDDPLWTEPPSDMSLETASDTLNSKGVRYGDLENNTLSFMSRSIIKALKENGIDQAHKEELKFKLNAIKVILNSRSQA